MAQILVSRNSIRNKKQKARAFMNFKWVTYILGQKKKKKKNAERTDQGKYILLKQNTIMLLRHQAIWFGVG